jgi:ABC-type multidrug transport system ATPase subunit
LNAAQRKRKTEELLTKVGLDEKDWNKQLRKFSKGMLQRVGLAQALINEPEIVFLDEPMSGLDPIGRREIRELIAELREKGTTVFMSTHILSDIEALCDNVAILRKGKLAATGKLDEKHFRRNSAAGNFNCRRCRRLCQTERREYSGSRRNRHRTNSANRPPRQRQTRFRPAGQTILRRAFCQRNEIADKNKR